MSHISKPVDWEVFNIPAVQPVQYYSILKKKREFSQLIKEYDAQVFRKGYLHYCGIVPKNMNLSLRNRYDIFIVFLGEAPNTSFIGFRVKVSKETFQHESNKLLLFLKQSKRATFYLMNNNCIQVQCGANAWELFYLLYDDYLRKYVLTIIGTQFFYHFVYSCCIQKELQLSEILQRGSKVIKISRKSIFFKIHGKRKISVTDLINLTLNLPGKRRYVTYFDSKEPVLYSDFVETDLYSAAGSKIQLSKLFLKKFKVSSVGNANDGNVNQNEEMLNFMCSHSVVKQQDPQLNEYIQKDPISLKRKLDEVENCGSPSTSKCFKAVSVENQWKQYQTLTHHPLKNYSLIPSVNPLVHKLLNENSYPHHLNVIETLSKSSTSVNEKCQVDVPTIQDTPVLMSFMNKKDNSETAKCSSANACACDNKTFGAENFSDSLMPNFIHSYGSEKGCDVKTDILPYSEQLNCDVLNFSFENDASFTTAAGKAINISSAALQKAQQLVENDFEDESKKTLPNTSSFIPSKSEIHSKIYHPALRKKRFNNSPCLPKILSSKVPSNSSFGKTSKLTKKFPPPVSTVSSEDVCFATAAGKEISISDTAMETAQNLIKDVFVDERTSESISGQIHKNENPQNTFEDIACSKTIEAIDETLVEKLFEDTMFDEKDSEITNEFNQNVSVSKCDKPNNVALKPRKSLGGRRTMKFSEKL